MRDQNGLYYYPNPADTSTRVYVRDGSSGPEFRLWRRDLPEVWEKHGWLPIAVIEAAAGMYKQGSAAASDPMQLYDKAVAEALIREDDRSKGLKNT